MQAVPETIFSRILDKSIPANIIYEDDLVTAFYDINPQAKTHILIIPNKIIPTVNDVTCEDEQMLGHLFTVARKIAQEKNIAQSGYRLIINCNQDAGQEVFHLHMHLLGGEKLGALNAQ